MTKAVKITREISVFFFIDKPQKIGKIIRKNVQGLVPGPSPPRTDGFASKNGLNRGCFRCGKTAQKGEGLQEKLVTYSAKIVLAVFSGYFRAWEASFVRPVAGGRGNFFPLARDVLGGQRQWISSGGCVVCCVGADGGRMASSADVVLRGVLSSAKRRLVWSGLGLRPWGLKRPVGACGMGGQFINRCAWRLSGGDTKMVRI